MGSGVFTPEWFGMHHMETEEMKKIVVFAAALLASASLAGAADFGVGFAQGSVGFSGVVGGSADFSGTRNLARTTEFGGAKAKASSEGYGQSESTFQGAHGTIGVGPVAVGGYGLSGGTKALSGNLSSSSVTSKGNGFGEASSGGASFGAGGSAGVGFGGSAGGLIFGTN